MSCQQYRNVPLKVRCNKKKKKNTLWLSPLKGFSRMQPDSAPCRLLQDFECVKSCVSGTRISSCNMQGSFLLLQVNNLDHFIRDLLSLLRVNIFLRDYYIDSGTCTVWLSNTRAWLQEQQDAGEKWYYNILQYIYFLSYITLSFICIYIYSDMF